MKRIVFVLGVIGMLFAGYISMVTFLSNACAFDKPCPYFLGYPACYFGFIMFTGIVFAFILDNWKVIRQNTAEIIVLIVSLSGILFSGYLTLQELPVLFAKGLSSYFFGLPTCAIGLVFYIGIFIATLIIFLRNREK